MYKQRFYLWVIVLFVVVFVKSIASIDLNTLIVEKKDIGVSVETDTFFKSKFLKANVSPINFFQTTDTPSVYIRKASNEEINGYKKMANAIYSPIILLAPIDVEVNSDLYYTLGNDAKFASFKNIAQAVLEDKTLSTFGVTDKDFKDKKIVLNIPPKDSFYYDVVVEQMYIALNDNKIPTQEEKQSLKETVDKLLAKSVVCNDVATTIEDMDGNYNKIYNIYITPEFVADNCSDVGISSGYGYYGCIHFEKSTCVSYDIFVKNESLFGKEDLYEAINNKVLNNSNFVGSMGFRTCYDIILYYK